MNLLQNRSQAPVQTDGFCQGKLNDGLGKGVHSVARAPGSSSSNFSSLEWRTLHDEIKTSDGQDTEKGAIKLTGKYAKYAGEPPDGGLKAWSVILACVGYRFMHNVPGADRNDRGSYAGPA
jgi:hypothetical protein